MTKGYFASTIEKYYLLNSEEVVTSMREKLKSESSRYQNRDQFPRLSQWKYQLLEY